MDFDNYYNRIKDLWESRGYTSANEFALGIGFNSPETINRLNPNRKSRGDNKNHLKKNIVNKPSIDLLEKILLKFPDLNISWLIAGKGPMVGNTTQNDIEFAEKESGDDKNSNNTPPKIKPCTNPECLVKINDLEETIRNQNKHITRLYEELDRLKSGKGDSDGEKVPPGGVDKARKAG